MGWLATGRRGGLVGNRYRLIERLGTGGMSVVWRAHDEVLGRAVAVKMLTPQLADDSMFRDRLRQEALAAAQLCHPHITGIFDFGESPLDENLTVPYVVMELNDGESVSARLGRQGSFPWRDAVLIAAEVASALAAAHARGVVHRDVTPANVMLTGAGAKVVDFGISALIGQRDAAADGSLLGTPAYLAPERLSGSPVSPATDVYSLGLLLYRTLTGRFPWPAGNTTEALRAHLFADPEPVPSLPGLPPEVGDLCLRCLAKQPGDRPTAAEAAGTLAAVVGLKPIIPPAVARDAAPGPRPSPHPVPRPPSRPPRVPALRLRTRSGRARAVRAGGPRPLGGGLFRGGALVHDLFTGGRLGDAVLAGRHRLQAGVATVVLIASIGLVWSSNREPVEVGTAQAAAAGAGPGAVAPHGSGCKVRYRVQRDSGTDFGAQVTLINTGEHVLSGWRLEFTFTGGQRLTGSPKRLSQSGRRLMLQARDGARLRPGRSETIVLSGSYRVSNPLPLAFKLNGHKCRAEVLGAVLIPTETDVTPAPPPSTRRPAASTPGAPTKKTPARKKAPAVRKDPPKPGFSVTI
ncbi:serine/threonine-protein kinase [Actinoplanes sp. NPDC026623]|uniref:serine/threonine-protein kinase n=1 Tax=Actinoplanes sp. NPDC026623 TaxID=3155610 RepID=UPI0033FFA2B0